jgi:tripartite-type tricarboxylate transporter receptor subunit TctC
LVEDFDNTRSPSLPLNREGKIRALATTGSKRNSELPEVLTVAEQGLKGYEAVLSTGYVMPANGSAAIVARTNRELAAVLESPEAVSVLKKQGIEAETATPQEFAEIIRRDSARWAAIVREVVPKPEALESR